MKGREILINFIKERLWSYIIGAIILVAASIVSSVVPRLLGTITDGLEKRMPPEYIYRYTLLMLFASVGAFVLRFCWRYFLIGNSRNVECYLRDRLFKHLQTLPVSFYNNKKTGDLVAYAINDIQAIRMTFGFGFVAILEGVILNSVSIFFMVKTINPIITIIALLPMPGVVFIMTKLRRVIRERFRRVQEAFAEISDKVQENISGIRVVKAFAQEEEETKKFAVYSKKRVDTYMSLTRVSASLGPTSNICFGVSFLIFIIYGSTLVLRGVISLGDYVAFNSYMAIIMRPIMNISRIIEIWQRGIASFRRLNEIFETTSDIKDGTATDITEIKGDIYVKNLTFTYPGATKAALEDVSFHLPAGKTLGILGTTGSGKSTIVNLLLRLYNVPEGSIFIDGRDINDIPFAVLRESIGCVPQDNFLFSTSIRNNIMFFRPVYTDEEVAEAAKIAGVYDNIVAFPDGFETVVGERGVTLSGGQKQRVSIARAVIKNPSVLILDDSLSSVDTKTEDLILGNIKKVLADRTGIIIAHRVSTVMHADEIIFMDEGRIIEMGNHEQLMSKKGAYYNLYLMQTAQNDENGNYDEKEDAAI